MAILTLVHFIEIEDTLAAIVSKKKSKALKNITRWRQKNTSFLILSTAQKAAFPTWKKPGIMNDTEYICISSDKV